MAEACRSAGAPALEAGMLKNKVAIVYGGGGAIGGAVARKFAAEGARVFLAGRTRSKLDAAAKAIMFAGGSAEVAEVDALDARQIEEHADGVATRTGRIDIAFNAVGLVHIQGTPLQDLSFEELSEPLIGYARTNFLTAKAVAKHMVKRRSGVLLTISTPGSKLAFGAGFIGIGAANAAVEVMTRHLAGELGPSGIRVVCLRPDATPETLQHGSHAREVFGGVARRAGADAETMLEGAKERTLLKRFPKLDEIASAAAFAASDGAGAMTGAVLNLTCGTLVD
jgi:3-oxoacyl-[acyl-carrier protein] reductase